jgi:hypothetical protein
MHGAKLDENQSKGHFRDLEVGEFNAKRQK